MNPYREHFYSTTTTANSILLYTLLLLYKIFQIGIHGLRAEGIDEIVIIALCDFPLNRVLDELMSRCADCVINCVAELLFEPFVLSYFLNDSHL